MKTLIGIPAMDFVSTSFMTCLTGLQPVGDTSLHVVQSSLIYDARNDIALRAVNEGYDRILWLDSDVTFPADLLERMSARMDEGYEFVSGLYFTRKEPIKPVIFRRVELTEKDGKKVPVTDNFTDYPRNDIFRIAACGFGCVMMTTDVVKRIIEKHGAPFSPMAGFGEDLSFCIRANAVDTEMYCDSSIKLGHIGQSIITESVYEKTQKGA
jgi:GT2 family glycosyltransferase